MLVIAWFLSHGGRGPEKVNMLMAIACIASQCTTAGPVYHHRVGWAWDDLAAVGGENYLAKHVLVRWLTLGLNLASHKKGKHILLLFQNAELTFLRRGCCLEHVCLFDVVSISEMVLQMLGLDKQEPESFEMLLPLDSS